MPEREVVTDSLDAAKKRPPLNQTPAVGPRHGLNPQAVNMLRLQRLAGNRAVQRFVQNARRAQETTQAEPDEQPQSKDLEGEEKVAPEGPSTINDVPAASIADHHAPPPGGEGVTPVSTEIRGSSVRTSVGGRTPEPEDDLNPKYSIVAPGGAPNVTNPGPDNTCTPSGASTLTWEVVEANAANWRVNVQSLTLAGQINIKPWPSHPTDMKVPNTPNPVDGGNINNKAGSKNRWKFAADDMADYNSAGGGAGPHWHSTAASTAHEWAHWNTDWIQDSVNSAAGGNWPKTNADLDALTEPKASSADKNAAKTALTPKVNARFNTWNSAAIARWNAIPDSPGAAGGAGYVAGQGVLNGLIGGINTYANTKGWAGAGGGGGGAGGAGGGGHAAADGGGGGGVLAQAWNWASSLWG